MLGEIWPIISLSRISTLESAASSDRISRDGPTLRAGVMLPGIMAPPASAAARNSRRFMVFILCPPADGHDQRAHAEMLTVIEASPGRTPPHWTSQQFFRRVFS